MSIEVWKELKFLVGDTHAVLWSQLMTYGTVAE